MRGRGFTMVELLLVIGIIAILAAILFPVFARAREKAREASCRANLLNIAMGLRAYAHDHDGLYPPVEDDLSPLYPRYLPIEQVFICPSQAEGIPMGAPANEDVWPAAQPTGTGPGEPGQLGHQEPPRPEGPPGMMRVPEEYAEGTLVTNYYYRAGRRHNGLPPVVLVADHEPAHNDRANVLMSDGAIRSLPEPRWRQMGFRTPDEILQERFPERYGQVEPGACCAPPMSPPEGPPREPPGEARE